jgi:hypothetical protein
MTWEVLLRAAEHLMDENEIPYLLLVGDGKEKNNLMKLGEGAVVE